MTFGSTGQNLFPLDEVDEIGTGEVFGETNGQQVKVEDGEGDDW